MSNDLGLKQKDTIYVDVDDEITGIIEKVSASNGKVVALVLPKRATVMQSVVNMKLLKLAAEKARRNLVLVTNEAGLLPIAGLVGVHVAATSTSKPTIPPPPDIPGDDEDDVLDEPLEQKVPAAADAGDDEIEEAAAGHETEPADGDDTENGDEGKTVGELAAAAPATALIADDAAAEKKAAAGAGAGAAAKTVKPKAVKQNKVPNFNRFRLRLILAATLLVLLIGGMIFANTVMPSAKIAIKTDASEIESNLDITLAASAKEMDAEKMVLPALAQTTQKTATQTAPATGQQNNGEKATGSVKMVASVCSIGEGDPDDVPAGSSLTSNGHTYITQEKASFGTYSGRDNGCFTFTSNAVGIVALKPGAEYNLGQNSNFTVRSKVTATGSAKGGTDNIVKVIAQSDIDGAKAKLAQQDTNSIRQDLAAVLKGKGYIAVDSTFNTGEQQITTSNGAGDKADNVTVTSTIPYTMLGVKQDDLKSLVVANVSKKIDKKKQKILDGGVAKAKFSQQSTGTANNATVSVKVKSVAGPQISVDDIKRQAVGKKSKTIESNIKTIPGVTDVKVDYSPFWVTTAPKNLQKITVQVDK